MLSATDRHSLLAGLTDEQCYALLHDWQVWARPNQLPPAGDWSTWLILTGRGWGKTRTAAEWVRAEVEAGTMGRIALLGATASDVRDVMVEGESGLLAIAPPWNRPTYQSSRRRLTWPNGAIATLYSAEEPERLRGPQHDGGWGDEVAAWSYYQDAWDNLMFGMRLGKRPRVVVTTTPKPAHPLLKDLLSRPSTAVTTGSTYENRANLADAFFAEIIRKYEGTSLGQQELMGLLLEEAEGALWRRVAMIDDYRVTAAPHLTRVAVAVDPAASSTGAETGIVVAGLGADKHGYVLADASVRGSPDTWARAAVGTYQAHNADRLIAEANQGGEMVTRTIQTVQGAPPVTLVHASRGKQTRAEPIAALYEQGKVHHVGGFPALEAQMCSWVPGDTSPDRLDAMVWAMTDLMLIGKTMGWA